MIRRLEVTIRREGTTPPPEPSPVPAGFSIRTVRDWDDPVMVAAGYDTTLRGAVGQFQVVACYVTDAAGVWCGTWSAISNYNKLSHADMMDLGRAQVAPFGFAWNDWELVAFQGRVLPDGYTLKQKMGWLYNPVTDGVTELWGSGEWYATMEGRFGAMVNGGQAVAVSDAIRSFSVRMPNEVRARGVAMRELFTFRRADWGKMNKDFPWLLQKATVANHPGNGYGEYPRGYVYVPVGLNPAEFDFSGSFPASRYYLPEEWLR